MKKLLTISAFLLICATPVVLESTPAEDTDFVRFPSIEALKANFQKDSDAQQCITLEELLEIAQQQLTPEQVHDKVAPFCRKCADDAEQKGRVKIGVAGKTDEEIFKQDPAGFHVSHKFGCGAFRRCQTVILDLLLQADPKALQTLQQQNKYVSKADLDNLVY